VTLLAGPLKVNLAERRINAGHSIRSLAREIGIGPTTLTRAETGQTVKPEIALAVAKRWGLEIKDVWLLDAPRCRRSSCTEAAVRKGLCEAHHEQLLDHAADAELEAA
jgi:DNA-binding XRE family transcriptional regulator